MPQNRPQWPSAVERTPWPQEAITSEHISSLMSQFKTFPCKKEEHLQFIDIYTQALQYLKLFLEIMDTTSWLKRKGAIWLTISTQFKSQHLWWYEEVLVNVTCVTSVKTPLMPNDKYKLLSIICCHSGKYWLISAIQQQRMSNVAK